MLNTQGTSTATQSLTMIPLFMPHNSKTVDDNTKKSNNLVEESSDDQNQPGQTQLTGIQLPIPMMSMFPMFTYNPLLLSMAQQMQGAFYLMNHPFQQMPQIQSWMAQQLWRQPQQQTAPGHQSSAQETSNRPQDHKKQQSQDPKQVSSGKNTVKFNQKKLKVIPNRNVQDDPPQKQPAGLKSQAPPAKGWDLRKRVKRDTVVTDTEKIQIQKSTQSKTLTQLTHKIEKEPEDIQPIVLLKNDGFIRIGKNYQADLLIEDKLGPYQEHLQNLKTKLKLQKVWDSASNQSLFEQVHEHLLQYLSPETTDYDVLLVLNHYKGNTKLLMKKITDKDPLLIHDLKQLKLSFKSSKKLLKKSQLI